MKLSTAESVWNMVENMLRNEPQSTFVWQAYPQISKAVAVQMAIDTVSPRPRYEQESAELSPL